MQDADNDDFVRTREVIDCVFLVEDHTQIDGKMRTRGTRERKCRRLTESSPDMGKEFRRNRFGRLFGQVAPDFR